MKPSFEITTSRPTRATWLTLGQASSSSVASGSFRYRLLSADAFPVSDPAADRDPLCGTVGSPLSGAASYSGPGVIDIEWRRISPGSETTHADTKPRALNARTQHRAEETTQPKQKHENNPKRP